MIRVTLTGNIIEIYGDLKTILYPGSILRIWLDNSYEKIEYESENISIESELFQSESEVNSFKNRFLKLTENLKLSIQFDENFKNKIEIFNLEEDKFEEFSDKALSIWNNKFDTSELKFFSSILEKKISNRKLYKLQLLASYHLAFSRNACNFSVPGAGKTSIVFGAFSYLNSFDENDSSFVNKLFIVGPPSSFDSWEHEYYECYGRKPVSIRLSAETDSKEKEESLTGVLGVNYNLFLITYQSIPIYSEMIINYCRNNKNKVMLICDEAHKIKNLDGIWSENILKISPYVNSRVILTGTPAPNGYEDLYNLFKFIYPNRDVIKFRPDYLKRLTSNPLSSDVSDLIDNIKPYFIRIKKSDLNLPKITLDDKIYFELDNLEIKLYERILNKLSSATSDFNKLGIHLRLIQSIYNPALLIKNNQDTGDFFGYEDSKIKIRELIGDDLYDEIKKLEPNYYSSRHYAVLDLIKKLKNEGKKVIIWGQFIDSIKRLNKLLIKNGLNGNYVIGETYKGDKLTEYSRSKIIDDFKNKSDVDYIITNPIVLGESISLHKVCNNAIYFELSYSAAPYIQSRDRIHRVWLDENLVQKKYETNYYHFISKPIFENNNIDEEIFLKLRKKWNRMLDIIEDDIPLFTENIEEDRLETINKIINDYKKNRG